MLGGIFLQKENYFFKCCKLVANFLLQSNCHKKIATKSGWGWGCWYRSDG